MTNGREWNSRTEITVARCEVAGNRVCLFQCVIDRITHWKVFINTDGVGTVPYCGVNEGTAWLAWHNTVDAARMAVDHA